MTMLLEIRDAHKRYGEQELLDGAEVVISDLVKVGLIGRNGAGKSTLCRVILGEEELDRGAACEEKRCAEREKMLAHGSAPSSLSEHSLAEASLGVAAEIFKAARGEATGVVAW